MDWIRFNNALHAKHIIEAEEMAKALRSGKIKGKDISAVRYARIRDNDDLMDKYSRKE